MKYLADNGFSNEDVGTTLKVCTARNKKNKKIGNDDEIRNDK